VSLMHFLVEPAKNQQANRPSDYSSTRPRVSPRTAS
jgi:hypothetical protein